MATKAPAYQAHELWWNSLRMHCKMLLHALAWSFAAQVTAFLLALLYLSSLRGMYDALRTYLAMTITAFILDPSAILLLPFRDILAYPEPYKALAHHEWVIVSTLFLWTLPVAPIVFCILLEYFRRRAEAQARPEYIRGAVLKTPKEINKEIRKTGKKTDFSFNDVALRVEDENQHCFTIGRPRQGKTQMLNPIILKAKKRPGAKGLIFDFKAEMWGQFGEPERGDLLFNPLDVRCLGWSIFNDCRKLSDIELFANALIPDPPPNVDSFWAAATRNIFVSILTYCYLNGLRTNKDIWRCISASGQQLKVMFEVTPGCESGLKHLEDPDSRQTACFLNELMVYGRCFSWIPDGDFSITNWLYNGEHWLFVASFADVRDALRPATRLFVEVLIAKHLSMPEDVNRRVYYFLDEASALGKLPSLEMALNQAAGRGASVWLLIQAFGQLDAVYGRDIRDAIVNGCGVSVMFSVADPNTAKILSEKIGDVEYYEKEFAMSYGVGNNRDGENFRRAKKTEKLFLPVEIMRLKKFECIIILPDFGVTKTNIKYRNIPLHLPAFILRPEFDLEAIAEEFRKLKEKATEYRELTPQEKGLDIVDIDNEAPETGDDWGRRGMELDIDQY